MEIVEDGVEKWHAYPPAEVVDPVAQSIEIFEQQLYWLAQEIPEIDENNDLIFKQSQDIIEGIGVQPDFFKDDNCSLLLAALSLRLAMAHEGRKPNIQEVKLCWAVAQELCSPNFGISHNLDLANNEQLIEVLDRFTDKELSKALQSKCEEELLDNIRKSLGKKRHDEQEFRVRVLSVGSLGDINGFIGTEKDSEGKRIFDPTDEPGKTIDQYIAGLEERYDKFRSLFGISQNFCAFVVFIGDQPQLCIPMPIAERLLYPELRASDYDNFDEKNDVGVLEHEFLHTQSSMVYGVHGTIGRSYDELHSSGRSSEFINSYTELDMLNTFFRVFTNNDLTGVIKKARFNTIPFDTYLEFAKELGLDAMLELALLSPAAYRKGDQYMNEIFDYLGGYNGLVKRHYAKMVSEGKKKHLQNRLHHWIDNILERDPERIEFVSDLWEKNFPFVASLLKIERVKIVRQQRVLNFAQKLFDRDFGAAD